MQRPPGFKSASQRENFQAAARLHQRGGPLAAQCGAQVRSGGVCGLPPLEGGARCLRHGGPAAAHTYRERQRAGLKTGRAPLPFEPVLRHGDDLFDTLPIPDQPRSRDGHQIGTDATGGDVAAIKLACRHPRPHPRLQDHQGRRTAAMALEPVAIRPDGYPPSTISRPSPNGGVESCHVGPFW